VRPGEHSRIKSEGKTWQAVERDIREALHTAARHTPRACVSTGLSTAQAPQPCSRRPGTCGCTKSSTWLPGHRAEIGKPGKAPQPARQRPDLALPDILTSGARIQRSLVAQPESQLATE
jgi:hypothetical protein